MSIAETVISILWAISTLAAIVLSIIGYIRLNMKPAWVAWVLMIILWLVFIML